MVIEPEQTNRLCTVTEAAEILKVSVATIHLYEREGLTISYRNEQGHRMFSEADIERIRCIRNAINVEKISISGIRHMLAMLPCWRIRNCPEQARTSCPAFSKHDTPCWMVTNKSWECKNTECRLCPVYNDYADCRSVKGIVADFTLSATKR